LPKPPGQLPHRGRVGLGLVGSLLGCPVGEEHHGADHFIAPLGTVHELQLQLREVVSLHPHYPPASAVKKGTDNAVAGARHGANQGVPIVGEPQATTFDRPWPSYASRLWARPCGDAVSTPNHRPSFWVGDAETSVDHDFLRIHGVFRGDLRHHLTDGRCRDRPSWVSSEPCPSLLEELFQMTARKEREDRPHQRMVPIWPEEGNTPSHDDDLDNACAKKGLLHFLSAQMRHGRAGRLILP